MAGLAKQPLAAPAAPRPPIRIAGRVSLGLVLALLTYALLAGVYFVTRAGGLWAENDSAILTQAIRQMAQSRSLIPSTESAYSAGYGYAAFSVVIVAFTGLGPVPLQQVVYPLLSALLVVPAFALYRELTGSRRAAALATLLLFLQPEFLFVVLRGSHERMLRALMFLALWLLVRSFRFREQPGRFAVHVALFYLVSYGLIATNAFFGVSFIVACATAMVVAWAIGRWRPGLLTLAGDTAGRLASVVLTVAGLGFVFIFYIYPPATLSLQALHGLFEKIVSLLLTTHTGSDPYAQALSGWASPWVYLLVSISDYLLILVTAPIWLWMGLRWLRGTERPAGASIWLLWLLYGAFALQGALGVVSDRTNLLGANLQHRSFPSFAMMATPLLALALVRWRPPRWACTAGGAAISVLAGLALLKATNEPSLSNKWTFYRPHELQALVWADARNQSESVWVGPDERLETAIAEVIGPSARDNRWDIYDPKVATRAFVISDIIRLQAARLQKPLPPVAGENRIYDSGAVQIYRLRPQTPYQR